jgi:hypothetical protein
MENVWRRQRMMLRRAHVPPGQRAAQLIVMIPKTFLMA